MGYGCVWGKQMDLNCIRWMGMNKIKLVRKQLIKQAS